MKHETESMHMAQKLTLMKNQILEYDRYVGMNRKYGAVKINTLKNVPVTVSTDNQQKYTNINADQLFLFIYTINCFYLI